MTNRPRGSGRDGGAIVIVDNVVVGDAKYLKALSGYKQASSVAKWCRKNGIKFFRNGQGWPVTTATELDRALAHETKAEPNLEVPGYWKTGSHWRYRQWRQRMGIPEPTTELRGSKTTLANPKRSKVVK